MCCPAARSLRYAPIQTLTSGSLTLSSGSTYTVDLNSSLSPSSGGYDQLNVTGGITLGGATLNVSLGFQPIYGEIFTIIKNNSHTSVSGTFAGLPEGATFYVGSQPFTISYLGNSENDVILTADAKATHFAVVPNKASVTAGTADSLTIEALDAFGNIDANYTGSATLTTSDSQGSFSSATVSLVNGQVVTTPGVTLKTAGIDSVYATGSLTSGSASISVTAAAASKFVVSDSTSNLTASSTANVTFSVTVEDAYGNPIQNFTDSVTLTDSKTAGATGSISSPLSFNAATGVATSVASLEVAGSQTISAHDTSSISVTDGTLTISVAPASATHLIIGALSPVSAGGTASISVTAEDKYNNIATSFTDNVTLSDSAGGMSFNTLSFTSGSATALASFDTAGTQTITALDTSGPGSTTATISVSALAASKFVISASTSSTTASSSANETFFVTVEDAYGNPIQGFADTVTLTDSAGFGPTGTISSPLVFNPTTGVATATGTLEAAGSQSITATDSSASPVASATSSAITVAPATTLHLVVGAMPSVVNAGGTAGVSITAEDQFGNVDTTFSDTVALSDVPEGGLSIGNLSFSGGEATVQVTLSNGGFQSIIATDVSNGSVASGTSTPISVSAAASVTQFQVTASPLNVSAGGTTNVTIEALDVNTVVTNFADSVQLTDSAGGMTFNTFPSFVNGYATVTVTLEQAGSQSITAQDENPSNASVNGTVTGISVTAGAANKFVINASTSSATASSSTNETFSVTVEDAYGNPIQGFTDTVTLTDSAGFGPTGSISSPLVFNATTGVATATAALEASGYQSITATDSSASPVASATSSPISIVPASATHLVVSNSSNSLTAGGTTSVSITAEDQFGNVVKGYNDTVALTDPGMVFNSFSFTGGKATVVATLETAGSQSIVAQDQVPGNSAVNGTATGISVTAGAANKFVISDSTSSATASSSTNETFSVTVEDAYGNPIQGFADTVTLTDSAGFGPTGSVSSPLVFNATTGVATATAALEAAGYQSITATDSSASPVASATSSPISIIPASATQLLVSNSTNNLTAGGTTSVSITAEDQFGNVVKGYNDTVALTDPGMVLNSFSFTGGKATVVATLETAGSQSIVAQDQVPGNSTVNGTATGISVTAGEASKFVISDSTSSATASSSTNETFLVTVEDAYGNPAQGFTDTVTLTDSAGFGPTGSISSPLVFNATTGVATATAALEASGYQSITATDSSASPVASATSSPISIIPASATQLLVSNSSNSLTAGGTTSVSITAEDQFGNVVKGYNDTVALTDPGMVFNSFSFTGGKATVVATLETAGSQSIVAQDQVPGNSTVNGTATGISVTAGAASKFVISESTSSTTASSSTNETFSVTVEDAYGNPAQGFTDTVTLTDSAGFGPTGSVSSPLVFNATTGVATATAALEASGYQSITATDSSASPVASATSSPISIIPASATQLLVSNSSNSLTAGGTTSVSITAEDQFGNVVKGYNDTVALNDPGMVFNSFSFTGGKATVVATLETAGSQSIVAQDQVPGNSTVNGTATGISVTAGAANKFVISDSTSSATASSSTNETFLVTVEDAYGNPAQGFTDTVTLTDSAGFGPTGSISSPLVFNATTGVATATAALEASGYQSITATDSSASPVASATSSPISIIPASATQLLVSNSSNSLTAGGTTSVSITAEDQFGNVVKGYNDTVALTDPGMVFNSFSFTGGKATVVATLETAGSQSIVAQDQVPGNSTVNGTATGISVTAGAANKFVISASTSHATASSTANETFSVTVEDAYGNPAQGFTDTVTLTDSAGFGPTGSVSSPLVFNATTGVATATAALEASGYQSITAIDSSASPVASATSSAISVAPASASELLVGAVPTTVNAGGTTSVSITALDQFGNLVKTFSDSVALSDPSGGLSFNTLSFSGGEATVIATLSTGGNQSIIATDVSTPSVTAGTSTSISVSAATGVAKLVVTASPTNLAAGSTTNVTIVAEDASNAVVMNFADSVQLTDSAGELTFNTFPSFANGKATVTVTLEQAGSQSITAQDENPSNATVSGTVTGISVTAGAANKFVISASTSSATASSTANETFLVTVEDAYGNPAQGFADTVTLTDSAGFGPTGSISSPLVFNATTGVATATAALEASGYQTITATDSSVSPVASAISSPISIVPASATHLVVSNSTSNLAAGGTTSVSITAEDQFGNIVKSYNDNVALTDPGMVFSSFSFTGGKATVTATLETAGSQSIVAQDQVPGNSTVNGTATGISVTAGAANKFVISQSTSTATASVSPNETFSVTVEDAYGNPVQNFTDTVTLSDPPSVSPSPPLVFNATSGVATLSSHFQVAGTYTITAHDSTSPVADATGSPFVIVPASTTQLVVSNSTNNLSAGGTTSVSITAEDQFGNVVSSFSDAVQLTDSAGGMTFNTLSFTGGKTTITATLENASTQSIVAQDEVPGNSTVNGTATGISVTAGAANKFVISASTSSATASSTANETFSVTVEDAYGNPIQNFTDTVTLTDSAGFGPTGTISSPLAFNATTGVATATGTLEASGYQSITATDSSASPVASATSSPISIVPASATHLLVSNSSNNLTAGGTTSISITAEDQFGNIVKSYNDNVALTDPGMVFNSFSFTSGKATVTATLDTAGSQSIVAQDQVPGNSTVNGTATGISVTAGAANKFVISASTSSATASSTANETFLVTVEDAYGNPAQGFTDTVTLTDSAGFGPTGSISSPLSFNATTGVATATGTLEASGYQSITATDSSASPVASATSSPISIVPASATHLVVSNSTNNLTAGGTTSVSITAEDQFGNVVKTFSDGVQLTDSAGEMTFNTLSFTGGKTTVTATLENATTQSITAQDQVPGNSTVNGTATGISVTAGAANKFLISASTSSATASSTTNETFLVTVEDAYGNPIQNFADTVTLTDSAGFGPTGTISSPLAFNATTGVATATAALEASGYQSITAHDSSATPVANATSSPISIVPASATQLLVSASPTTLAAGAATLVSITAEDQFNNVVTGFSDNVTLSDSLGGEAVNTLSFSAGKATVAATLDSVGTQTITATDTASTLSGTSAAITVSGASGVASKLLISTSTNSLAAGSTMLVTVTAEDSLNEVVSTFGDTVTLSDSLGGATITGGAFNLGKATFVATLDKAGSQSIAATDISSLTVAGATSGAISVTALSATHLVVSAPATDPAGTNFNLTVTAEDQFGNPTNFAGTVTITTSDVATGVTVSAPASLSGGVGTFNATLIREGNQTLTATSGITGTTTVDVTALSATHFVVGIGKFETTAVAFPLTVIAADPYGNPDPNFTGTVTLSSSDGGATLPSPVYTFTAGDNGIYVYNSTSPSNEPVLVATGAQSITATSGVLTGTGTTDVVSNTATHFVITSNPSTVTAGQSFSVTVTAEDAANNVAATFADTVNFTSSDTNGSVVEPNGGLPYTFTASGNHGVATLNATLITEGTQTITATDQSTPTITGVGSFTVTASAATNFVVTAADLVGRTSDEHHRRRGRSVRQCGTELLRRGDVVDSAGVGPTGSISNALTFNATTGVATASAVLEVAGAQTITVVDTPHNAITGTSGAITVTPAAAAKLVVSAPGTATTGTGFNATVTAEDTYNNVATGFNGTATLTSSGSTLTFTPPTNNIVNGTGAFSVTFSSSGSLSITASDSPASLQPGTSSPIVVSSNGPAQFVVTASPASVTAGGTTSVTITAEDSLGHPISPFTDTVSLSDSLGGETFTSAAFTGGVATFTATLDKAGTQTISAVDAAHPGVTTNPAAVVSVSPSTVSQFVLSATPSAFTAGGSTTLKVTAEDQFNNVVVTFANSPTVTLADSDGPASASFSNPTYSGGIGTYTATLGTPGNQTISASITGASGSLALNVGATAIAPVLTLAGTATNYATTFQSNELIESNVVVTDNTTLTGATIQITNLKDGTNESLAVNATAFSASGLTSDPYNAATGTLTLTGPGTVAEYESVLNTLMYNDAAASPNPTTRNIQFTVTDANGLKSNLAVATVSFTGTYTETAGPNTAVNPVIIIDSGAVVNATSITERHGIDRQRVCQFDPGRLGPQQQFPAELPHHVVVPGVE